jgi:ArsR family transcriptional regulator
MEQLRAYKASVSKLYRIQTRIAIVEILRDGELSAGAMQARLGIEQANLSQHLTSLRSRQSVVNRKGGNQVLRYRVNWRRQFMSSQLLSANREAHIWARLMQAQRDDPSQEVARYRER